MTGSLLHIHTHRKSFEIVKFCSPYNIKADWATAPIRFDKHYFVVYVKVATPQSFLIRNS